MRFSTRTRYGLRFLLRLAAQPKDSLLQLGQVAREENISSGYLEQIVRALKPLGILRLTKGRCCQREQQCSTRGFWKELDGHIRGFLQQHTLREIIESEKHSASGGNYVEL